VSDRALIEEVFWKVCLADFPGHTDQLSGLLPAAIRAIEDGKDREFNRACRRFLEDGAIPWPRYDIYRNHWSTQAPNLIDEDEEDGEVETVRDNREAGELLAHRIIMSVYAEQRRQRLTSNVADRPYWKLVSTEGCPGCMNDPHAPQHWQSDFWQNKVVPCEWLGCKSRVMALTVSEAK
jgi:hypothetical protein